MPEEQRSPLLPEQRRDEDVLEESAGRDAQHVRGPVTEEEDGGSPLPPEPAGDEDVLRPGGGQLSERAD